MTPIYVYAGDVFFTHSSTLLGRAIRWAETDSGEAPTWANHAGVIVQSGWIGPAGAYLPGCGLILNELHPQAVVVEALWETRRGPLVLNGTLVRVFGPIPPYTPEELSRFLDAAGSFVGTRYGYWKLAGFLVKRWTKGRVDPTKWYFIDGRPICSYLAAKVSDAARKIGTIVRTVAGVLIPWGGFGVPPQAADPDSMLDYCESHPDEWKERV